MGDGIDKSSMAFTLILVRHTRRMIVFPCQHIVSLNWLSFRFSHLHSVAGLISHFSCSLLMALMRLQDIRPVRPHYDFPAEMAVPLAHGSFISFKGH